MSRHIHHVALLVILILSAPWSLAAAPSPDKPNILFILTDDQGYSSLGCYGGKLVATPHLDRLAAEGARFTDAYATPQCTPTRASLLTGQYSSRHGMWHVLPWYGSPWAPIAEPPFVESLPRETVNLAKRLKAADYRTACIGKWHLTSGADGNAASLSATGAAHFGFDVVAPQPRGKGAEEKDKFVEFLTDRSIAFIESPSDRPWFCLLTHHTVHGKVYAPEALVAKYLKAGAPADGLHNATYRAALEHLDTSVGRLMAAVDRQGSQRQTMVVFMSDNGGVFQARKLPAASASGERTRLAIAREEYSNTPLRAGKGSPYEGGIRVPLIIRWRGVAEPGLTVSTPVHVVDMMPTLCAVAAAAAAPANHPLDGVNLLPLLKTGGSIAPRPLMFYMPLYDLRWAATPCAAVRDGDLKLIEYFGDSFADDGTYRPGARLELYDLRNDLGEQHDLSAARPDDVSRLQKVLRDHLKSVNAVIPGPNPKHQPAKEFQETRAKPND
ncbi:sulfatase [Humisphaera borealis]|uniref:Sulfatase n=1 Tax=Humisphaera borealis TaxID=2807512 RepID=A0A7M2WYA9_9BACT|nr:sulfatase [Humisphaera borealis]QOV90393.1 sulfatase [Humisphaera borealis]